VILAVRLLSLAALFACGTASAAPPDDLALVDAAIRGGRLVQAQTMLDLLPDAQSGTFDVAVLRAQLMLAQGQYAEAERAFGKLAATPSDDCRVVAGLGSAAAAMRHTKAALARLQDATTRCPADWRLWADLGHAYDSGARWNDSKAAYERASALGAPPSAAAATVAWAGRSVAKPRPCATLTAIVRYSRSSCVSGLPVQ